MRIPITTICCLCLLSALSGESVILASNSSQPVELMPGETHVLEFPELGKMAKDEPARCEVWLPQSYTAAGSYPLFVWFAGGKGNHRVQSARELVDFERFIVVALPYPDGRLPRLGVRDGGIEDFRAFQYPMLERVKSLIPNISETVRIVGGSSSGGHLIGSALDLDWPGYTDYFTAFILHEGGTSPNMTFQGVPADAKVLITYGGQSKAKRWQQSFMEKFRAAHEGTTFIEIPDAGHGLNADGKQAIHEWIEKDVLPTLEAEPVS